MAKAPLIGFNSDEDTKRLAQVLAARLKYENVSEMLRSVLRQMFAENFTPEQVSDLLGIEVNEARSIMGVGDGDRPKEVTLPHREKKVASGRK